MSLHDNGDLTYTVVFSEAVTIDVGSVGSFTSQLLLYSGDNSNWGGVVIVSSGTSTTHTFQSGFSSTGDTPIAMMGQEPLFTAPHTFLIASPQITAT